MTMSSRVFRGTLRFRFELARASLALLLFPRHGIQCIVFLTMLLHETMIDVWYMNHLLGTFLYQFHCCENYYGYSYLDGTGWGVDLISSKLWCVLRFWMLFLLLDSNYTWLDRTHWHHTRGFPIPYPKFILKPSMLTWSQPRAKGPQCQSLNYPCRTIGRCLEELKRTNTPKQYMVGHHNMEPRIST